MRKIINSMNVTLLVLLAIAFTACNEQKSKSKTNLNHVAATEQSFVIEVAAGQLIEKSNILNLLSKTRIDEIFESAKRNNQEVAARNFLDFKNGAVDYNSRIYIVANATEEKVVINGNIKDYNKFNEAILNIVETEELASPKEFAQNYKLISDSDVSLIYNKEHFIIALGINNTDELTTLINPKTTLAQMPYVEHLDLIKNDVIAFGSAKGLIQLYQHSLKDVNLQMLYDIIPESILNDLYAGVNISFEKGKIVSQSVIIPATETCKKEYEEFVSVTKTSDKFNKYISDNALVAGIQNLKGSLLAKYYESILNNLSDDSLSYSDKMMIERIIGLFSKIEGDIAYTVNSAEVSLFGVNADYSVFIETKDTTLYSEVKDLIGQSGLAIQSLGDNKFSISNMGMKVFFEYKDNCLRISSNEDNKEITPNISKARYYKGEQDYGFFVIDLKKIAEMPMVQQGLMMIGGRGTNAVNLLDYFKVTASSKYKSQMELNLNNSSLNSLELIVKNALEIMGE